MDATAILPGLSPQTQGKLDSKQGLATLDGDEFMKLMITELQNQDPLEPAKNDELLRQISTIREMELNSTLTNSLTSLVENQRLTQSAALIGQYALGHGIHPDTGEATLLNGVVIGLRFNENGEAILELDTDQELPLKQLDEVTTVVAAAELLVGSQVAGEVRNPNGGGTVEISGVVLSVRLNDRGEAILQLDTGEELPLRNLITFKRNEREIGDGTSLA
jgi:flagellar basal-body rod modification protein FlgD